MAYQSKPTNTRNSNKTKNTVNGWKILRIVILLTVLVTVAFYDKVQKLQARSWSHPLQVVIYPINGDNNNPKVNDYINTLNSDVFQPVDQFIQQQSQRYKLNINQLTQTQLGTILRQQPPESLKPNDSVFSIVWWSIKLRYWAYKNTPDSNSNLHRIRVFVYYHEPTAGRHLEHSLGLNKGLIAIVHAFADKTYDAQNNVVIVHELLHTVEATDKYAANHQPMFPIGYAAPNQSPLYPQDKAEIMAMGIPLTETSSRMATNLEECVIGEQTAKEINWQR